MNNSYCYSHNKTPYELVYGNKSRRNCTLIAELFLKNIRDEEDISEMIEIENSDDIESLDNDLEDVDDTRDNNTSNTSPKS
ncbi:11976_t:CDS:2, partial [Dentiscutata heterogama]